MKLVTKISVGSGFERKKGQDSRIKKKKTSRKAGFENAIVIGPC